MMTVKFKDRSELVVSDEQGRSIEDALTQGAEFIRSKEHGTFSRKSIDKVIPGGKSQADILDPWATDASQQIEERKCKASHSIQKEINDIAKDEGGTGWAKLITDMKWREQTRQKLLEADPDGWCDYKAGKCVCYDR